MGIPPTHDDKSSTSNAMGIQQRQVSKNVESTPLAGIQKLVVSPIRLECPPKGWSTNMGELVQVHGGSQSMGSRDFCLFLAQLTESTANVNG
jgi:hypothetical protein